MKKYMFFIILLIGMFPGQLLFSNQTGSAQDRGITFVQSVENYESDDNNLEYLQKQRNKYVGIAVTGVVFTIIGAPSLIAGIGLGVYHQINPANSPGSIHIAGTVYFNPVVLALNLTGLALLGIGIPLMIYGGVQAKRYKRMLKAVAVLPQGGYDFQLQALSLGVVVRI